MPPNPGRAFPSDSSVAIFVKPNSTRAAEVLVWLVDWLEGQGLSVVLDEHAAAAAGRAATAASATQRQHRLAVVLGGDGTMLHVARHLAGSSTPVLGVNLGTLGFLTETSVEDLQPSLEAILDGRGIVESRGLLHVRLTRGDRVISQNDVFNDAVVSKAGLARIIDVQVRVDGENVGLYRADGVIVATPTGSTGYSLSAGGPVLHASVDALLVTPISSHALSHRPLIVAPDSTVELRLESAADRSYLTLDGQQGIELHCGDSVDCFRSSLAMTLVRSRDRSFYDILRTKLHWG